MKGTALRSIAAAAFALPALAGAAAAAPLCVNPTGKAPCFATIQAAVNSADAGDTITIFPGRYKESVQIPSDKDGLQISGTSALAVIVDLGATGLGFGINSANVTVQKLTILSGDFGVVARANGAILQRLRILGTHNGQATGIFVLGGVTGTQILFNEFRAIGGNGIATEGGCDATVVKSNTMSNMPTAVVVNGANLQVTGNRIQVAGSGVRAFGDLATVSGNSFENVIEGITVTGKNPVVDGNRGVAGVHLAQVFCTNCNGDNGGGEMNGNVGVGMSQGINASPDGFPFHVERNTMTDSGSAYFFGGTGVDAKYNTAVGATSLCFWSQGNGVTLTYSTATRCRGAAYYITGSTSVIGGNTATDSGAFGFEAFGPGIVLTNNKASYTDGQGFGMVGTATATVAGNAGFLNRLDFCNNTGNPGPSSDANDFESVSTTCDIPYAPF